MIPSAAHFASPLMAPAATKILADVLFRIHLLRSQIVHGSSTSGSRLNRQALADCIQILQQLIPVVLNIAIDPGVGAEWPPLCYPPTDPNDPEQLRQIGKGR